MINSQRGGDGGECRDSISKGMGDQFSAEQVSGGVLGQYIKGDG